MPVRIAVILTLGLASLHSPLQATMLSDSQLYFDPDSISPDFYPMIDLPDLGSLNSHNFAADGDPILDADILPVLKPGAYPGGYVFSQSDYDQIPNVDYFADLTDGTLTTTFETAGVYHVRVQRQSGSAIFAVFADAALERKVGAPDRTGANRRIPEIPDADMYLIDNGDPAEVAEREEILTNAGQYTERVDTRQEAIDKIIQRSQELGRKIHVEIAGHGAPGEASLGAGVNNVPDSQIDAESVQAFQEAIDHYVSEITFFGMCSVGRGAAGMEFLDILASSIGKASAWDSPIYRVDSSHYTVDRNAQYITVQHEIPEPSSFVLAVMGALALLLPVRRRCRHWLGSTSFQSGHSANSTAPPAIDRPK